MLSLCCEACKKVIFHVPSELEADTLVGRGERNYEIPSLTTQHCTFAGDAVNNGGDFIFNGMNG